jgi:hypothetical protein
LSPSWIAGVLTVRPPRSTRARAGPACGGLERLDEAVLDDLLQPPVLPTRLALAGRYSNGERPAPGSRASVASRSAHFLDDPATVAKLRQFDRVAEGQGVSPAGLALAWLLNHPVVTAPVVSVSKESQWQGIHEASTLKWTDALGELLDKVFSR